MNLGIVYFTQERKVDYHKRKRWKNRRKQTNNIKMGNQ